MWGLAIITILLLFSILAGSLNSYQLNIPDWFMPGLVGMLIACVLSFVILFLGLPSRMYVYAWGFGLSLPASAWIETNAGISFPLPFFAAGALALLVGLVLLLRFRKAYPLPERGPSMDGINHDRT